MNPDWLIDEATFAAVRDTYAPSFAGPQFAAQPPAPLFQQFGHTLDQNAQPDAEFFVDTWTLGLAAASQNLDRRRQAAKNQQPPPPAWDQLFSSSVFATRFDVPLNFSWPPSINPVETPSANHQKQPTPMQASPDTDLPMPDEFDPQSPLTVETACRLLGVAPSSTRDQIKAAYRKLAARFHPDRVAQGSALQQQRASERMATINAAYRLLCAELT